MLSPVDRDVIRRKLDRIVKCLQRMRQAEQETLDQYLDDLDLQFIIERQLELAIGAAVDANVHILAHMGLGTPADAFTSFLELSRLTQAIPQDLAQRLAPSTGLRNRLAHEYEALDQKMVYQGMHTALELFPQYIAAIETYLSQTIPESGR